MGDDWLEIGDEEIEVEEIMRRIRERLARSGSAALLAEENDPAVVAETLWQETIGETTELAAGGGRISIRQRDCDIVPSYYVIDWRIPILGPLHAVVRRVINAEIRRYLLPSLRQQSTLNRKLLRAVKGLAEENDRLRQEVEKLRGKGS